MSDKNTTGVPFDSEDALEQDLWTALAEMPQETPSPQLRREFYRKLDQESAAPWYERLRDLLGFSGNAGWATAALAVRDYEEAMRRLAAAIDDRELTPGVLQSIKANIYQDPVLEEPEWRELRDRIHALD